MSFIYNSFIFLLKKLGLPTKGIGYEFVKNTGWIGIGRIIESLLSYAIIILLSRYLGAEGLGQYSFIFAFSGFFFILADWGLTPLMVKDLSRKFSSVNKYVSNILTFKLLLLLLSLIIYSTTIFFIDKNNLISGLFIAGLVAVSSHFSTFFLNFLRVKNNAKIISIGGVSERLFALIAGGVGIFYFSSLNMLIVALLLSQLFKTIYYYYFAKKHFSYSFSLNWKFLGKLIKLGYPFIFVAVFSLIYVRIDTIMLSFMNGDLITGFYNASYKLIDILNLVPIVLLTFGFPMFSRLFNSSNKLKLKILLEKILQYSAIVIFPIVVGVLFLSSRILNAIYGFNSVEAALAFKILIIAEVFVFFTFILGQFIAAVDKQRTFAKIAGVGAIVNIALNLVLIPIYSLYGAAAATLITYVLMFILMRIYIVKNILKFNQLKNIFLPFLSSVFMGLLLYFIFNLQLVLIIFIGFIFYCVCLFSLTKIFKQCVRNY